MRYGTSHISLPAGRQAFFPNPLPFCPPERSVWRAPARRSLGAGGKRIISSVQKRFGFRQTNAPGQPKLVVFIFEMINKFIIKIIGTLNPRA
jgi:hypothetical protein